MSSGHSFDDRGAGDRRRQPRFEGGQIAVTLRPRGRLGAMSATALDFNRHGIAVHTTSPLTKDRVVYLTLKCGELRLDNLVGVVHNCVRQGSLYRSGIRFRPTSELQRDKHMVEDALTCFEAALAATREANA